MMAAPTPTKPLQIILCQGSSGHKESSTGEAGGISDAGKALCPQRARETRKYGLPTA